MNSLTKHTNRIAGLVSIVATVVICGGTLSLADYYARSGTGGPQYVLAAHQSAPAALKKAG